MTDDITKDDLKSELEDLQGKSTVNVTTEVITIREKMTDDRGNLIDEKIPDSTPPKGYVLGNQISTNSPVCTVYELTHYEQQS